jgi:hypothetical protein
MDDLGMVPNLQAKIYPARRRRFKVFIEGLNGLESILFDGDFVGAGLKSAGLVRTGRIGLDRAAEARILADNGDRRLGDSGVGSV